MQHRTINPAFYNQTSSAFVAHACANTSDWPDTLTLCEAHSLHRE
jgi:hypothetical protein